MMMIPLLLAVALNTALSTASTPSVDRCAELSVTTEQGQCLKTELSKARARMRRALTVLRQDNAKVARGVQQAQAYWLKYSDSQCRAESLQFEGGSLESVTYGFCAVGLTMKRVAELEELHKNLQPPK